MWIYKIPSTIPPMLDKPLIKDVTPASSPFPSISPNCVDTGPVKIESHPQLHTPMINKHDPVSR